jgi:pyruvate ferredoxin oxidoreductase alpha subunit
MPETTDQARPRTVAPADAPPSAAAQVDRRLVGPYGATYDGAVDLAALRRVHRPLYRERATLSVDGNTAAAIPFLQWWRCPIVCGFPITPATKWLEYLAAHVASGAHDVEVGGRTLRPKRVKLLEAEHAAADYLAGVAAACRSLIVGTASSSVGLDHMSETLRSLGASGLGNAIVVDVCRATANYPLCIEGDPSDALAHRDDGFVQVMCRGKQQIYDTLLQLPAVGMHPAVLTPTMPSYYGIKDSHRTARLCVEPDEAVNDFLDEALALGGRASGPIAEDFLDAVGGAADTPPGLLDGDTAMGNCVTSAFFQGFKVEQKRRQQRALAVLVEVSRLFEQRFGRRGIELFERHAMEDAEVALVCMGPDAGTAAHLLPRLREELGVRVGLIVPRVLSPFPSVELARALERVSAIAVVNNAHHHGRGHLTLDVEDALAGAGRAIPVESVFCGLGGADVSPGTWRAVARIAREAAERGRIARRWHQLHEGAELAPTEEGR